MANDESSKRDRYPGRIVLRTGAYSWHVATYVETVDGVPVYRTDDPSLDSKADAVAALRTAIKALGGAL